MANADSPVGTTNLSAEWTLFGLAAAYVVVVAMAIAAPT